jgi:uncharacterized protein (TIGR02001 family)
VRVSIGLTLAVAGALACLGASAAAAQSAEPMLNGYVTAATAYWNHGLAQNPGATLELGFDYQRPSGLFVGARAENVDYAIEYSYQRPRDREINAYVGYHRRLPNWSWNVALGRYLYPGTSVDYDYDEVSGSIGVRDKFFYTVSYADNFYSIRHSALNQEVSFTQPLRHDVEVGIALGRFDLHGTLASFTHWNLGVSKIWRRFVLDLRYYDSGYRPLTYLGDPSDEIVLSASFALRRRGLRN